MNEYTHEWINELIHTWVNEWIETYTPENKKGKRTSEYINESDENIVFWAKTVSSLKEITKQFK